MRLLLDTHALLWWLDGDRRLSRRARALLADETNDVIVSAASAWEIATKARLGKLPGALDVAADVDGCVRDQGFTALDITIRHAQRAGGLAWSHRDPFDRMLAAQGSDCPHPSHSPHPSHPTYSSRPTNRSQVSPARSRALSPRRLA